MSLRTLDRCLACDSPELRQFVDFGSTPLANAFQREPNVSLPTYPLAGNYCPACSHAQLTHAVDPDLMFKDYLYVSSTSDTFQKHCRELAADVHSQIRSGGQVLDLACNDGLLMECFAELGHPVAGVDPAENLRLVTQEKNLDVEVGYWTEDLAHKLSARRGQFETIVALNVMPHVGDPLAFLRACKLVLADGGKIVVQNYYGYRTFKRLEMDQFYHEHLSYWTIQSFEALAARAGLRVTDAREFPIHGGSIRLTLSADSAAYKSEALFRFRLNECTGQLDAPVQEKFAHQLAGWREWFRALWNIEAHARHVVAYGAAAKANTALAYMNVQPHCFVDDSPAKWGYYMPGSGIAILDPKVLADLDNPLVLITAWNFAEEIEQRVRTIRGGRPTRFLLYQPEPMALTC